MPKAELGWKGWERLGSGPMYGRTSWCNETLRGVVVEKNLVKHWWLQWIIFEFTCNPVILSIGLHVCVSMSVWVHFRNKKIEWHMSDYFLRIQFCQLWNEVNLSHPGSIRKHYFSSKLINCWKAVVSQALKRTFCGY